MDEQQQETTTFNPKDFDNEALNKSLEEYRSYLFENAGLQGEEGYDQARSNFKILNRENALRVSQKFQELSEQDPTFAQKVDAYNRGLLEGGADVAGMLPDISQAIANSMGISEGENRFGSKNLSRTLQKFGLGYYTTERLSTPTDEPYTMGDMPFKLRPFSVGGEETGYFLSYFAPQALAARFSKIAPPPVLMNYGAKTDVSGLSRTRKAYESAKGFVGEQASALNRALSEEVQRFARNPAMYSSLEASVGALQAISAGVAEKIDPGDSGSRMLATLAPVPPTLAFGAFVGHVLNQSTKEVVPRVAKGLAKNARILFRGQEGIEQELANYLSKYYAKIDADPNQAIKGITDVITKFQLKEGQLPGTSVGLLTGDKNLLAIESALINGIEEIKPEAAQEAVNAVTDLNDAFRNLLKIENANPELVRLIADARITQTNLLFTNKVNQEVNKLRSLVGKNFEKEGVARLKKKEAIQIKNIIDKNYDELRNYEDLQWDRLDKTLTAQTNETQLAISNLIDEGATPFIPQSLSKIKDVRDVGETIDPIKARGVTSGDLINAKKEIGKQKRKALRTGDKDRARQLSIIENGIINDMNNIGAKFGAQLRLANASTVRTYGFLDIPLIKKLYKPTQQGNFPPPDLVLEETLLGDQQLAYNSFNDLLIATKGQMLSKEDVNPLGKFYLAAASKALTFDGQVDVSELSNFLIKNEEGLRTLGMFETLKEPRMQALFVKKLKQYQDQILQSPTQKVLSNIVKHDEEGVHGFINKTLRSANRRKELFKLSDLIKRKQFHKEDPIQAYEGLQQSILENLIAQSEKKKKYTPYKQKVTDFKIYDGNIIKELLSEPKGATTLEQDLIDSKIFTKQEVGNIKMMADKAIELEKNLITREGIAPTEAMELLPKHDMVLEILGRLGGVAVAQGNPLVSGIGHELVVSAIFSRAGKDLMSRLPDKKIKELLVQATRDPVLMRRLLKKTPTPKDVRQKEDYVLNFMVSKKMLTERERYDIEDSVYGVDNADRLQKEISEILLKGNSPSRVMKAYETSSRLGGAQKTGPYTLDMVQQILNISDEERSEIIKSIPSSIRIKRGAPQQRLQEKLQAR